MQGKTNHIEHISSVIHRAFLKYSTIIIFDLKAELDLQRKSPKIGACSGEPGVFRNTRKGK